MVKAKVRGEKCWVCGNEKDSLSSLAMPKGEPISVCNKCHRIVVSLLLPELFEHRPNTDLPVLHVGPDWKPQEGRMRHLSTAAEVHLDVDRLQKRADRDIFFMDLHKHKIGAPKGSEYKKKVHKRVE